MSIKPYQYEWTATNAQEALKILDAARQLIEARLMVISPNDVMVSSEVKRNTPLELTLHLDEAAAVLAANEVNALIRADSHEV